MQLPLNQEDPGFHNGGLAGFGRNCHLIALLDDDESFRRLNYEVSIEEPNKVERHKRRENPGVNEN